MCGGYHTRRRRITIYRDCITDEGVMQHDLRTGD
nr:MAG TPA: hypothetical protein [Caudoviricetes sp.]